MIPRIFAVAAAALTALTLTAPRSTAARAPSAEKQRMIDLGIEHETARALYDTSRRKPMAASR